MQIIKDAVVSFHYRLLDEAGKQLESSEGGEPTAYLHGHDCMLQGIEKELEGKAVGDALKITLEQPYGPRHDDTIQRVPLKYFRGSAPPKPGMLVVVNSEQGAPRQVTVLKVGHYTVDVDTNHPLAGMDLTYDLTIADVRMGTSEELKTKQVLASDDAAPAEAAE